MFTLLPLRCREGLKSTYPENLRDVTSLIIKFALRLLFAYSICPLQLMALFDLIVASYWSISELMITLTFCFWEGFYNNGYKEKGWDYASSTRCHGSINRPILWRIRNRKLCQPLGSPMADLVNCTNCYWFNGRELHLIFTQYIFCSCSPHPRVLILFEILCYFAAVMYSLVELIFNCFQF